MLTGCVQGDRLKSLDDDGFLVFAEDAAESVRDFADRRVSFDRCENCGHEILRSGGSALEFRKRPFDLAGGATRAQRPPPLDRKSTPPHSRPDLISPALPSSTKKR